MDALALRRCTLPSDPRFPFSQVGVLTIRSNTPEPDLPGSRDWAFAHPRAGNNSSLARRSHAN